MTTTPSTTFFFEPPTPSLLFTGPLTFPGETLVAVTYGDMYVEALGSSSIVEGDLGLMNVDTEANTWSLILLGDDVAAEFIADNAVATYSFSIVVTDAFGTEVSRTVDMHLNNHGISSVFKADGSSAPLSGTDLTDLLIGSTASEKLNGLAGNDRIYAGSGDDTIDGGAGADILFGEAGYDQFIYDAQDTFDGGGDSDTMIFADRAEWETARDGGYAGLTSIEQASWSQSAVAAFTDPSLSAEQTAYIDLATGQTIQLTEFLESGIYVDIQRIVDHETGTATWLQTLWGPGAIWLSETTLTTDPLATPDSYTDTQLDTDGNKPWDSVERTYDTATGDLLQELTTFDNGATHTKVYQDGQMVSQSETDSTANDKSWSSRTTTWDSEGTKLDRTTLTDDGLRIIEGYDAETGSRTSRSEFDDADAHNWASSVTTWDETGKIKQTEALVMDDGLTITSTYGPDGRLIVSRLTEDTGDTKGWVTRLEDYDAGNGKLSALTTTLEDGTVLTKGFGANGTRKISESRTDGADSFDWALEEKIFNTAGALAQMNLTMDDGDIVETVYLGGAVFTVTTFDVSGDEEWHVERLFFDADGNVTGTDHFDDVGLML